MIPYLTRGGHGQWSPNFRDNFCNFVFSVGLMCKKKSSGNYLSNNKSSRKAVLRIRDIYPGSEFSSSQIRIFSIPDPHQSLSILTKKMFQSSEIWSNQAAMLFIPDPDFNFLPIPDPGVKKAPDPDPQLWF